MASKSYQIVKLTSTMSKDKDEIVLAEIDDRINAQVIRDNLQEHAPRGIRYYVAREA